MICTAIMTQAGTIGELRATVATLESQNAVLTASTSTQAPEPSTEPAPLWRPSWAVYSAVIIVVVAVLVWVLLPR